MVLHFEMLIQVAKRVPPKSLQGLSEAEASSHEQRLVAALASREAEVGNSTQQAMLAGPIKQSSFQGFACA